MFNFPHPLIIGMFLGIFMFPVARGDGLTVRLCKGIECPDVKKGPLMSTSPKTAGHHIQPGSIGTSRVSHADSGCRCGFIHTFQ